MKYRVGDLFKWVNDECHIPDAMGDVYVLVKDYTLKEGEKDIYLEKEEDTYSLLTVYNSEGDYSPFSSELPYEVIEDRIDECLYKVGNVADINSCETVEFEEAYDDDDCDVYDYPVEEDDDKMVVIDIVEKAIKAGKCGAMAIGCYRSGIIDCDRCPFSYDSKLNEEHVGCACLSQEEINDIARRFLNGEER